MTFRKHASNILAPGVLAFADLACLAAVYAAVVSQTLPGPFVSAAAAHSPHFFIFAGCWLAATVDRRCGRGCSLADMANQFRVLLNVAVHAAAYSIVLMMLFDRGGVQPRFLAAFCGAGMVAVTVPRLTLLAAITALHRVGCLRRSVLIVGANDRTRQLAEQLRCGHKHTVVGVLDDDRERVATFCGHGMPYLGGCSALQTVLRERPVDDLFIGLTVRSHFEAIRQGAQTAERQGVAVHMLADLFPSRRARPLPMRVSDIPVLALSPIPENRLAATGKRAIDFIGATALLVVLSPLFVLVAVIIKMDSQGPVFFFQERAGCNQRRFRMVKFRTMVANAEELREELEEQNEVDGPAFKLSNDPRITRVGAFMRKHSIDELPQLINVWKGEMSLVGPRPAVAADAEKYTLDQRRRLSVKQGMTGLWQVSGRHGLSFEEWLRLDLDYIDSWSLSKDFVILLKTFREVVQGKHAA